jgi:hypothetical protein
MPVCFAIDRLDSLGRSGSGEVDRTTPLCCATLRSQMNRTSTWLTEVGMPDSGPSVGSFLFGVYFWIFVILRA